MLDELLLGGEVQETSKKNVLKAIAAQDLLQEVSKVNCMLRCYGGGCYWRWYAPLVGDRSYFGGTFIFLILLLPYISFAFIVSYLY